MTNEFNINNPLLTNLMRQYLAVHRLNMNQDYDYHQHFSRNIKLFKLFGFWKPHKDMKFKNLYHCYTFFWIFMWIVFLVPQMVYVNMNRKKVQEVTGALYLSLTFTFILVRLLFVYINTNSLEILIKELNQPVFQVKCEEHFQIASNTNRRYEILYNICLYLGMQTDFFGIIFPWFSKEKTLLAAGWFPYDWRKPSNYYLTYIFQEVLLVWNTLMCYCVDIFTHILLVQTCVQCEILCYTLEHLDDFYVKDGVLYETSSQDKLELKKDRDKFSEAMSKNLAVCVEHHRGIMRFAMETQRVNGTGIFLVFLSGALVLCTCLFQLSVVESGTVESFMLLFYLVCMLAEQFLYCWFGNEVIYKSTAILQSAYNTPWVDCNVKFQKILLQFMTQTYRPISILTGGLFTMSVSVFINVIRTSYSYFTLLKGIQ